MEQRLTRLKRVAPALLAVIAASSAGAQTPVIEFAVREVLPPYQGPTASGILTFEYNPVSIGQHASVGDLDQDGLADVWVEFKATAWPATYQELLGVNRRMQLMGNGISFSPIIGWPTSWGPGSTSIQSLAVLRSGSSRVVAGSGTPFPIGRPILPSDYRVAFSDIRLTNVLGTMENPTTAPPGLLPPRRLAGAISCGDLDNDGFDELTVSGISLAPDEDPLWLLIDGATRTVKWADYFHPPGGSSSTSWAVSPRMTRANRFVDVDGDGIADPVVAYSTGGLSEDWVIRCLSGMDGALIWEYSGYIGFSTIGQMPIEIGDIDGDGFPDIALRLTPQYLPPGSHPDDLHGYLRIVSGKSGTLIWSIPLGPLDQGFVPGASILTFFSPAPSHVIDIPDVDDDGVRDIVLCGQDATTVFLDRYYLLSGADGALIDAFDRDRLDVHAWWQSDLGFDVTNYVGRPVSDMDGDGWPEWLGESYDSSPSQLSGRGFGLFGFASLLGPDQAQEGDSLGLEFWLPGAPSLPVRLLASEALVPYNGFTVGDGRNTHLGPSPLFNATRGPNPIVTVLDAKGKATLQVTIPVGAGLAGKRLYFTGVVGDPASSDGIRCLTTTYSVEILP